MNLINKLLEKKIQSQKTLDEDWKIRIVKTFLGVAFISGVIGTPIFAQQTSIKTPKSEMTPSKMFYIKDHIFHTMIRWGSVEKEVPMSFSILTDNSRFKDPTGRTIYPSLSKEDSIKIKNNITKLADVNYLKEIVDRSSLKTRMLCKNEASYQPIKDTEGDIYINAEGHIIIDFIFKAENELGIAKTGSSNTDVDTDETKVY